MPTLAESLLQNPSCCSGHLCPWLSLAALIGCIVWALSDLIKEKKK